MDLSRLNTFLLVERFKMETPESVRASLIAGEWVSSMDLSDAHIPFHQSSRKYLTQSLEWTVNQKFKLNPTGVFLFCSYYLDSALIKPSQRNGSIFTPQPLRAVEYCFHPWCLDGWVGCRWEKFDRAVSQKP